MMERFFYEGCYNQQASDYLKDNEAYPLVRELNFKYGLKVLTKVDSQLGSNYQTTPAFLLVNNHGMALCTVGVLKTEDGKPEYCYRSPYYLKLRGENRHDKETIRSKKISSLMATLKRQSVVPNDLMARKAELATNATTQLQQALGSSRKYHELDSSEVQALLAHYLGVTTNQKLVDLDIDKCKIELDKLNEADRVAQVKTEEVNRFFADGYYQFGIDDFGHLIVGKFRARELDHENKKMGIEAIEPFKRYIDPAECAELAPLLTMIKVAYEDKAGDKTKYGTPIFDGYDESLDTVFYYTDRPTRYDCMWMFTPIGGVL